MADDNSALITALMNDRGVDPGLLALMKDNDGAFSGNGGLLLILFLLILGRGGLFGGAEASDIAKNSTLVNETNYSRLMDAISTQGTRQEVAIGNLANSFGASIGDVKMALAGMDKSIALANGSIINAVQSTGADIGSKIGECCCKTNLNIERSQNAIQSQIAAQTNAMNLNASAQNLLLQQQTQQILGQMNQNQIQINEQFCAIRNREDQREIQALRDRLAEQRDTANTTAILNAIANKDTVAVAGTVNSTAGTWVGNGTLS